MSVEDWARREAEREAVLYVPVAAPFVVAAVQDSLLRAFSALLSDKAVEAAWWLLPGDPSRESVREALQAAIAAVTEGDTE